MTTGNINKYIETVDEVEIDWRIANFPSHMETNWSIRSPPFAWSLVSWELEMLYTSGHVMQLFLHKSKFGNARQVELKLGIRLKDGTTQIRYSIIKSFTNSSCRWGTDEFIRKSELVRRQNQLLPADILNVSCSLTRSDIFVNLQREKYASLDDLSSDFKSLFGCTKSTDTTIIVGGEKYLVHKAILAVRSTVFAAMFQHSMQETNSGIVKVDDCEPTSFKDFLLYLYTGKVENFSSTNVCHVYKTADKYSVQELKGHCIRFMKRNISTENFFDIIMLANHFEEKNLLSHAKEFFNRNSLEIIKGAGWEELIKHNFSIANQLLISKMEQ